MKIIKAGFEILTPIDGVKELQLIEQVGRTCYKSEDKMTSDGESAKQFVEMIIKRGHEAMLEHSMLSIRFIVDRGVSHELVRHRIASFAQESTRYCNYSKYKFGNELTFIEPCFQFPWCNDYAWKESMQIAENYYFGMLQHGAKPQEARSVLPNSLKTEIVMTANYREWRNFFKLRTTLAAHPQMREVTIPLLQELKNQLPIIFDDIEPEVEQVIKY